MIIEGSKIDGEFYGKEKLTNFKCDAKIIRSSGFPPYYQAFYRDSSNLLTVYGAKKTDPSMAIAMLELCLYELHEKTRSNGSDYKGLLPEFEEDSLKGRRLR